VRLSNGEVDRFVRPFGGEPLRAGTAGHPPQRSRTRPLAVPSHPENHHDAARKGQRSIADDVDFWSLKHADNMTRRARHLSNQTATVFA
jgi:hypothetical protein